MTLVASTIWAAGPQKDGGEAYAVIAGTVFQQSGFLVRGAEIEAAPLAATGKEGKGKRSSTRSDTAGEFAIRVPAGPGRYQVTARARGFEDQTKEVEIYGNERSELLFHLEPARQ